MNKSKKKLSIFSIFAIIVMLFVCIFPTNVKLAKAETSGSTETRELYAFASIRNTHSDTGKVYVDLGLSLDLVNIGVVDRNDVEIMTNLMKLQPYESAKIYVRTRNVSAIAEEGDYEPLEQTYTVTWRNSLVSVPISINKSEFTVGNESRHFIVEIYKVEITGLKDGYTLVNPTTTPSFSTQRVNIGSEMNVKMATETSLDGSTTLGIMSDMVDIRASMSAMNCLDVETNTSFDTVKVDLAAEGNDWLKKMRYMSQKGMMKLGVELDGGAAQSESVWLYIDDSFVGIQLFVGDSTKVGAPALEGVPTKNTYTDPSVKQYAMWFTKFEEHEAHKINLIGAFNGKFDGVTVQTELDSQILVAHALNDVKAGQGGIYDSYVDYANPDIIVINDLDEFLGDQTVLSARTWAYRASEKHGLLSTFLNYVPVNYRASIVSATSGSLRYDENGRKKIGLSVRFSEPMQLLKNADGSFVGTPSMTAFINGLSTNEITYEYVAGNGSDTLYFEADVSNWAMNINFVTLQTATNFNNVYDFAPNAFRKTQNLNLIQVDKTINGWTNISTDKIECSYDTRRPEFEVSGNVSKMVKTSHSVTIRTYNVSDKGTVYYGWVVDENTVPQNLLETPVLAQGFQTLSSPSKVSGERFLYVKICSEIGEESEPDWVGPYYFDNDAPTTEVECVVDTYQSKEFDITITNKTPTIEAFTQYANMKKSVQMIVALDPEGKEVLEEFTIPLSDIVLNQEEITLSYTLNASDLGMKVGTDFEYGTVYVFFKASDTLENTGISEPVPYYFDVRDIFGVEIYKDSGSPDFEMQEFADGGILDGKLDENYYTLDLSKMDNVADFFFKFKVQGVEADDSSISIGIDKFVSVATGESILSYLQEDSANSLSKITIKEKFEPGLYELVFKDKNSTKKSVPLYFYVTNGKNNDAQKYQEETGVYKTVSTSAVLTNSVFQIPTSVPFYYLSDIGALQTKSYSNTNKPATFSSWVAAYNYISYLECLDMYAITLTSTFASDLNNGIYRKATNVEAKEGQVWIRYKDQNWRPNSTTSSWVYYYYSDEESEDGSINLNALSDDLAYTLAVISTVVCTYGEYVNLVTDEYLDSYGAPTVAVEQMRVAKESSDMSLCGTKFSETLDYMGDSGMYLSLDPDAPLSTNVVFKYSENRRIYYKTQTSEYKLLTDSENKTFGEYFNVTDKLTILELDENGVREYCVYIDKTAPTVTISWKTDSGTNFKEFSQNDSGQTISGQNFFIESMKDYDTYSFVSIYKYTGYGEGDLLSVHRKSEFDAGKGVRLEDGKYHLHVSDRSGNDYSFVLQVKSEALLCTIKEVENSYIQIDVNRNETEIRYQVYLDGWLITTDFATNRFTESGEYRFLIEDIYGNVHDETYIFSRDLPVVDWRYQLADGTFATYEENNELLKIHKIDEQNYAISTSTYLRFYPVDGSVYEILSGDPAPSKNPSTGWVTFNNKTTFTMKVYYEKHPETYVIYNCSVDNFAPSISVTYEKSIYRLSELDEIKSKLESNGFEEGDNDFKPSFIGFKPTNEETVINVSNGEIVQSNYFKVQVSDESGVQSVKIYIDGELVSEKKSDFSNIFLNRKGFYRIVATDNFGNEATFTFANEYDNNVQYFVDGKEQSTDFTPTDYFDNEYTYYSKVEYGNDHTEIRLSKTAEVHYLISDNGKKYHIAFIVEDGLIYSYKYIVNVAKTQEKSTISSISQSVPITVTSGEIARIDELKVAIYLTLNVDGTISLTVRSIDGDLTTAKNYTVETRVSLDDNENLLYFKTKISNVASSVSFVDENGELYTNSGNSIKVNGAFKVLDDLDDTIVSVQVAFSLSGKFDVYETVYDLYGYKDHLFTQEGTYHVKVLNEYGIQTDYYVVLSSNFMFNATVEYNDGTVINYSTSYTFENDEFYSNKSVEFTVYSSTVTFVDKSDAISVTTNEQGYTVIYVDTEGSYVLIMEDEYGNVVEKKIVIKADTFTVSDNLLTNFNPDALRLAENYTNNMIFIDKEVFDTEEIAYIGMIFNGKTTVIYDEISQQKTDFDDSVRVGMLGDGEYTLVFRDICGNKQEKVIHYCGTSTLKIVRNTVNSLGSQICSPEDAVKDGVWTNHSVHFTVSASQYVLKVDGMDNVMSISYDSKTKDDYSVYYVDEYGFKYEFNVYLYRAEVEIKPSAETKISVISETPVTKGAVKIDFSQSAICSYVLDNGEEKPYNEGDVLYKDGIYHFKAIDKAGNLSTYTIKKDSAVEYRLEGVGVNEVLVNGGITNGSSVKFVAENQDSAYIKKVFHNNELVEYDNTTFTERGKWELLLADEAGNESYFRFYILYGKMDGFTYRTPYDYEITSVTWKLGNATATAMHTVKENNKLLEVTDNGTYTVAMRSTVTGTVQTFTFTVDKTPPQVELVGCKENEKTINNITVRGYKVGDTIYVYKDGKLSKTVRIDSETTDAPVISESGKYRIVVKNEAGITTELTFERKFVPNVAGSILIIVLSLTAVIGLLVGLIWRNHSKTDA